MKTRKLHVLLEKFLSGTISSQEEEELNQWYRQQNEKEVIWESDTQNEEAQVARRMLLTLRNHIQPQRTAIKPFYKKSSVRIAAAASVLLLLGYFGWFANIKGTHPSKSATISGFQRENKYVILPDSSVILLGKESNVKYTFNKESREVWLDGEAFFDVRNQKHHPFTVHTGTIHTTVLGTSFNVNARDQKHITVSVHTGKVAVSDQHHQKLAILNQYQQLVYTGTSNQIHRAESDMQAETAWMKSDMEFADIPFGELANKLSRRYGISIHFKNSDLSNCPITGRFNGSESLEDVMETITKTLGASFVKDGDQIILDGPGCPRE